MVYSFSDFTCFVYNHSSQFWFGDDVYVEREKVEVVEVVEGVEGARGVEGVEGVEEVEVVEEIIKIQ